MTKAQLLEPIPLRPDPGALRERNLKALVRACIASARAKTTESGFSDTDIAKKNWPHDEVAGLIVLHSFWLEDAPSALTHYSDVWCSDPSFGCTTASLP